MKKYLSIIFITLAVAGSSCKKTYLDELATNPNTPSSTTPNLALAGALKTTGLIFNNGNFTMYANWMGYLSWSTGYQPNVALELYSYTTSTYDVFTPLYLNINNYTALLNSTNEVYYQAIAKIMIAYDYQALVDNYNNVPYSQALQGTSNLTPAYDNGSAIYDDLLKQLDAAIALIGKGTAASVNPGTNDIMYKGDMLNWARFANTLKLRIAVRQSNLTAKTAALKASIAATAGTGYLNGGADAISATVNPGYTNLDALGGQQSPLDLTYGYNQSGSSQSANQTYQANSFYINFFQSNNDPRLTQVYATSTGGVVIGTPFGQSTPPSGTPSKLSAFLLSPTRNAYLMGASEALFLQAEAAASGLITGTAGTLYNSGITASFSELGLTGAQAATYIAQPAIAYPAGGSFATQQQAILTQKWAALGVAGALEAFNEYRRTGIPNVPVSILPGVNTTVQPSRILYPFVEYQTNAANVAAQGTIDKFTSKIFWAK